MKENKKVAELKGYIRKIFPDAIYEGKTYGYHVEVELLDGTIVNLFDPDMFSDDKFRDQMKKFEIHIGVKSKIDKCEDFNQNLVPSKYNGDTTASFCGIIEEILEPSEKKHLDHWRGCIVNIGIGTLYIRIHKNWKEDFTQFKVGDGICVENGRLDLKGIH